MARLQPGTKINNFCKKYNLNLLSYNKHLKAINMTTNEKLILSLTMIKRIEQNPVKFGFLLKSKPHKNQLVK